MITKKYEKQRELVTNAISVMGFRHRATINYKYNSEELKNIIVTHLKGTDQECAISTHVVTETMKFLGYEVCHRNHNQTYFDVRSKEVKHAMKRLAMI